MGYKVEASFEQYEGCRYGNCRLPRTTVDLTQIPAQENRTTVSKVAEDICQASKLRAADLGSVFTAECHRNTLMPKCGRITFRIIQQSK